MRDRKISVIGLGYVGLPVAVAFGQKHQVVAFDINKRRIETLKAGHDFTLEVTDDQLQVANLLITGDTLDLQKADFHIIAVPTPIDHANKPNLTPLLEASKTIGSVLKKGDIVVYESTVYPGATEEECVPILEQESNLICGVDFFVGYSPERINPGDKQHTFTKIRKVVSGQTAEICDIIAGVYESVIEAGVFKASSIKVAEAAKVIENSQRDINIAFINELSRIFHLMGINTYEVLEAAATKWNFLAFKPGLVGGHCIGVDPYYLTYKAEQLGYHPEVILSGRRINDSMGKYVAELTVKEMIKQDIPIRNNQVAILGFTFKENCPDVRNTKVLDIINELKSYNIKPIVIDDQADKEDAQNAYGVKISPIEELTLCDSVIIAVAHDDFKTKKINDLIKTKKVIVDVKNIFSDSGKKVSL
ncbi:nucleotide sugar dehydrogenase [Thiotrichales bacterium 19S3-7]|nr:nucleotide sugar dehydrogenase [Thiotrichales bacterium 19S3-7]MCF6800697.1 nucleotide sugar dehydrogenase [Thiotrichales bacterium 19S3-11]